MIVYIARRQNTVAHYIATWPIMELCLDTAAWPGARVSNQWLEHDDMSLAEAWTAAEEGRMGGVDDRTKEGTEQMQRG